MWSRRVDFTVGGEGWKGEGRYWRGIAWGVCCRGGRGEAVFIEVHGDYSFKNLKTHTQVDTCIEEMYILGKNTRRQGQREYAQ